MPRNWLPGVFQLLFYSSALAQIAIVEAGGLGAFSPTLQLGPRPISNGASFLYIAICYRVPPLARQLRYGERRLSQIMSEEYWMPGGGVVEALCRS